MLVVMTILAHVNNNGLLRYVRWRVGSQSVQRAMGEAESIRVHLGGRWKRQPKPQS